METTTEKSPLEVTMSLLSFYCERNPKGQEASDILQTILMMQEQQLHKCRSVANHIMSEDFKSLNAIMDALKVKLISKITNL